MAKIQKKQEKQKNGPFPPAFFLKMAKIEKVKKPVFLLFFWFFWISGMAKIQKNQNNKKNGPFPPEAHLGHHLWSWGKNTLIKTIMVDKRQRSNST